MDVAQPPGGVDGSAYSSRSKRRRRAEDMLGRAKVQAAWGNAPTPEDIRKLDQERLLQSALLIEPAGEVVSPRQGATT